MDDLVLAMAYAISQDDGTYKIIINDNYSGKIWANQNMNVAFWDFHKVISISFFTGFDTSNVTNLNSAFSYAGAHVTDSFEIIGLDNWNVYKVNNFYQAFLSAGEKATTWSIGDISNWNTSNVTTMEHMFHSAGKNAVYSLDLSNWDVSKVTNYRWFYDGVADKITPPVWVN